MVLTNFECWANVGNAGSVAADIEHHQLHGGSSIGAGVAASRQVDLFNPRAVQQNLGPVTQASTPSPTSGVSHISSNGYYGFAYVNAVHELNNNNNNNNISCINYNNNNNCNSNNLNVASTRCKKRFFVPNDDEMFAHMMCGENEASAAATAVVNSNMVHGHGATAKRCRYDDDFAAQYFNDFFNMQAAAPPTQIGTQSCLMDTEDLSQQQQQQQLPGQQQVDVAMKAPPLHSDFDSIPTHIECNFSGAPTELKVDSNKLVSNSSKKSIATTFAACTKSKNLSKLSTHAAATAAAINDVNPLLQEKATKLETLFAGTHGGSQFHCWQFCSNKQNGQNNDNNLGDSNDD